MWILKIPALCMLSSGDSPNLILGIFKVEAYNNEESV